MRRLIIFLAVLVLLTACVDPKDKKDQTDDPPVNQTEEGLQEEDIAVDQGEADSTADRPGEVITRAPDEVTIPDNYPEDEIPLYDKGKPELVMRIDDDSSNSITLLTKDDYDEVLDYYMEEMGESEGFQTSETLWGVSMSGTKDGIPYLINVGRTDGVPIYEDYPNHKTLVSVTYFYQ